MNPIYVTSPEHSKSLYDMGVRVKSEYNWIMYMDNNNTWELEPTYTGHIENTYPAYISDELMAVIPAKKLIEYIAQIIVGVVWKEITLPDSLAILVETGLREKWLDLKAINGGSK